MATYVAATILGGFLGRFLSGAIAGLLGWRSTFVVLASALTVCYFLLARLDEKGLVVLARPTPGLLLEVLREKWFLRNYSMVFLMFLVFAAIMNFMPFRLTDISGTVSEIGVGAMYSGYMMGLISSLFAAGIGRSLGGPSRAIVVGLSVFAVATLGFGTNDVRLLFAVMFVFCGAMFFVHATAAGLLNRYAGDRKGVVNGLYVAFYYGGGVVGSWAPGAVYGFAGWQGLVIVLFCVALFSLALAVCELRNSGLPMNG